MTFPLTAARSIISNKTEAELVEIALRRDEGVLSASGAFTAETGQHTGRSPNAYAHTDHSSNTYTNGQEWNRK